MTTLNIHFPVILVIGKRSGGIHQIIIPSKL